MKKSLHLLIVASVLGGCAEKTDQHTPAKTETRDRNASKTPRGLEVLMDENLETALRENLKKPRGAITREDLLSVRELLLSNKQQITDLAEVKELRNLTRLVLRDSPVSDLTPLAGLTQLNSLALMGSQVNDLSPLQGLTHLQWLYVVGNPVDDLTPLSGLTYLGNLGLMNCRIIDLKPLAGLTKLTELNLKGNRINNLTPLTGLKNLKLLYLQDNPVPEDQKALIGKALPDCKIEF